MDDPSLLSWIEKGRILAAFLVAIGVSGEFLGDWLAKPIERRLAAIRTTEMLKLNKDISDANERAAKAELDLALLKAPRTLNLDQQKEISETLKPFAGRRFDIASITEPEPQALVLKVEEALRNAGWVELNWRVPPTPATSVYQRTHLPILGIVVISGVIIQMHPEKVSELMGSAKALASALDSEGIPTKVEPGVGMPNINTEALHNSDRP